MSEHFLVCNLTFLGTVSDTSYPLPL